MRLRSSGFPPRKAPYATPRLGHVAKRKHERLLVTLGKSRVEVSDAKLRIAQLLGEPVTLLFRRGGFAH